MINKLEAILSAPRKSVSLTNMVVDGNFPNRDNWIDNGTYLTTSSNEAYFLANSSSDRVYQNKSVVAGRKYYACVWIKATSGANVVMGAADGFGTSANTSYTGAGLYQFLSCILTSANTTAAGYINAIRDERNSGWDVVNAKYASFIDLTTAFGAGNEPNKQTMDNIMEQWTDKWLNGTQTAYYY